MSFGVCARFVIFNQNISGCHDSVHPDSGIRSYSLKGPNIINSRSRLYLNWSHHCPLALNGFWLKGTSSPWEEFMVPSCSIGHWKHLNLYQSLGLHLHTDCARVNETHARKRAATHVKQITGDSHNSRKEFLDPQVGRKAHAGSSPNARWKRRASLHQLFS